MSYESSLQIYYCKQSESPNSSHRIAPAPLISISPEIYYANDNIIGYTYNITLDGYANALRKDLNNGSINYGLSETVDHIADIRNIFNSNGGNLYVKDGNQDLLIAKGATIKKIEFKESDNLWVNYSPFTIEIEFNEIDFLGCSNNAAVDCSSSIFHQINNAKIISDNLVNITQYKIKEFSDKWTFTIDDKIYENFNNTYNNIFTVNYTISATGKNYYINDKVVPAWQQARLFVQDRLYKQVKSLLGGHLQINNTSNRACDADKDITSIHDINSSKTNGSFEGFSTEADGFPTYDIYNETISCDTSEASGSFSVTYIATVKKHNPTIGSTANAAIHTYTKEMSVSHQDSIQASINIKGTIQGLVRGGFLYYPTNFVLPQNGTFVTSIDSNETKYANAMNHYSTIVGSSTDLYDETKSMLNITKGQLLIKGETGYPIVKTFSLDHNYNDGSITYNATYERSLAVSVEKGFTNISIIRNDPIDIIQEFIIPGRSRGPIIQKLNMKTPRTISVNIDGASPLNKICTIEDICASIPYFSINNFEQLLGDSNSWLRTKEDYNVNRLDGSYSINLEYTIRSC